MENLFICYGFDDPEKIEIRLANREKHLERITALDQEGHVITAGPMLQREGSNALEAGFAGSLLLVRFPDLASAKQWWDKDPYVQNGLFRTWGVNPYISAFPKTT